MRGEARHSLLARSKFLGAAATEAAFELVDLGAYPALVHGGRTAVRGELYAVGSGDLAQLDRVEGVPDYYRRETITLADRTEAQSYLLAREDVVGRPRIPGGDWRQSRIRA
jgi:gamma-glutamylaminecyclotransferase